MTLPLTTAQVDPLLDTGGPPTPARTRAQIDALLGTAPPAGKTSPLSFATDAAGLLEAGLQDAYYQGYLDAGGDPDLYDEAESSDALNPLANNLQNLLVGLGALAIGEAISTAMADARMGQYGALLNPAYELGYDAAVKNTYGQAILVTWHTAGDGDICDLCDERDGQQWTGEQDYPHPGEGTYGEQCEGGPNCRCELWYDVVPADTLTIDMPAEDVTASVRADLTKLVTAFLERSPVAAVTDFLLKYSEDQPRDEHGRWTADGAAIADSLNAGGTPDVSRAGLAAVLRATQSRDNILDLTRLRVGGQPIFGGGTHARLEMPQIPSKLREGFFNELQKGGISVTREQVDPNTLHPIQREMNASAVAGQLDRMRAGDVPATIITADNYILDGHHTWAAGVARSFENPAFTLPVIRIGMSRDNLLNYAWAWDQRSGITPEDLGQFHEGPLAGKQWVQKFSPDQPRDDHGRWSAGGGYEDLKGVLPTNLTTEEQAAVLHYQYSTEVNDYLRNGYVEQQTERGFGVRSQIRRLDAALAKTKPLPVALTLYRGTASRMFDGKAGFRDKAYLSSSQSLDKAKEFARWAAREPGAGRAQVIELRVPAGTRALPIDHAASAWGANFYGYWPGSRDQYGFAGLKMFDLNGQEWLLPRGTAWAPAGTNDGRQVYELKP